MTDLITIFDVHAHLNIPTDDTSNDIELQGFMDTASEVIDFLTDGPVIPTAFTEQHNGGSPTIALYNRPVISVASLVETTGTTTWTLTLATDPTLSGTYGYTLDADKGIITRRANGAAVPFLAGRSNVLITYTAGYATVPPTLRLAALNLVKHLYGPQQGPRRGYGPGTSDETIVLGYSVPNAVRELIENSTYDSLPGIG